MEGNLSQGGFNLGTVLGAVGVSAGLAVWDVVAVTPWPSTPQESAGREGVVHEIPSYSCSPQSWNSIGKGPFLANLGLLLWARREQGDK